MVSIVQDTEGTRGPQSRGSQASVHAANAPPVYATGKAVEPTPNPLILHCPQSSHSLRITSVSTRRRGDASCVQKYVSGSWVMLCFNVMQRATKRRSGRNRLSYSL